MQRTSSGVAVPLPPTVQFQRGVGQPLPPAILQKMESVFGARFGDVRVHTETPLAPLGTVAVTRGPDIYFARGHYDPHTAAGQHLLGRELAHVVQQRTGRVQNPFGRGVAIVHDARLEAEAERMAIQASRVVPRAAVQPKRVPIVQPHAGVPLSGPTRLANGGYRIVAGSSGMPMGSVVVSEYDAHSIEVSDLAVAPPHRKQGLGAVLMASALRTGLQLGKTKAVLASRDNGSGHLTRWYRQMGFEQVGHARHGYARMEAPIERVLPGVAQRCVVTPLRARLARPPVQRLVARRGVVQRSSKDDLTLGFEDLQKPKGYGSVSLSAKLGDHDLGEAWSKKTTYCEGTEHAEDAVIDYIELLEFYSDYGNDEQKKAAKKMLEKKTLVITGLTSSPCSSERGTCTKKDEKGCAERLIELAGRGYTISIQADKYYQPKDVEKPKDKSKLACQDMEKAKITIKVSKE